MLIPLSDAARARLARTAVVLCAASSLLVPLAGRGAIEIDAERAMHAPLTASIALPVREPRRAVFVERDPFVPQEPSKPSPATGQAAGASGYPDVPQSALTLPANRGAAGTDLPSAVTYGVVVRAIVTGADPRALLDENGTTRLVAAGDTIDGVRITRIDRAGIRLTNGVLYSLAEDGQ